MKASAELRRDLRIARNLNVTLAEFLGEPSAPGEPRFDAWEQGIWRAFDSWEADVCPGCGQPRSESLFDKDRKNQPKYEAGFYTCLSCKKMLEEQEDRRAKIHAAHRNKTKGAKHPEDFPQPVLGHEQWSVWQAETPE